jgi:hypothetical protein
MLGEVPHAPAQTNREPSFALSPGFQAWKESVHRPIEFYGKVVDENDQPIGGAKVIFSSDHLFPQEGSLKTNTMSDQNGLFSLSGVMGRGLGVEVKKTGYYPVKRANQTSFDYRANFQEPFHPDAGNPVVFHLRKRGAGTELITSQRGISPLLEVPVPRDGSPVYVDFTGRKVGSSGHLLISQVKPEYLEAKKATAWSFRMAIAEGGFIEQNDEFPFEAPESGYQPIVELQFNKGQTNWTTWLKRNYYIAFGQPRRYGVLDVDTLMGSGTVRLRYAINPDGSRNLEPKEAVPERRELPPGVTEVIPDYAK